MLAIIMLEIIIWTKEKKLLAHKSPKEAYQLHYKYFRKELWFFL